MAVPTVSSITPARGHTGGRTLVEIAGTGFALPPTPPAPAPHGPNAPLPDPAPSVSVTFGGVAAPRVWVVSSTLLRALTPIHEPAGGFAVDENGNPVPAVDVAVQNLDTTGAPIGGELGTLAEAYSFVRPNLATPGITQRVIEEFVRQLRIQILENVKLDPNTDFDPDSGDGQNFCDLATLPGIAIVDIKLPKSEPRTSEPVETQVDETTWIARRPPQYRDVAISLIGAAENTGELLTLEEALEGFFRKNAKLWIQRDPADPSHGFLAFTMVYTPQEGVTFTGRIGETNVTAFMASARIYRVPRTDIPGLPTETIPGLPAWFPAEATTEVGRTADTITITPVRK